MPTYQEYLNNLKLGPSSEAGWLCDFRLKAYGKFQQIGLPTRKNEAWKYMNLEPVLKTAFAPASPGASAGKTEIASLPSIENENNPFVLINSFSFDEIKVVKITKDSPKAPIHLSFRAEPANANPVFYPRYLVIVEDGAKAEIVLDQGDSRPFLYLMNSVMQIRLAKNAELSLVHWDRASEKAIHLNAFQIELAENSKFEGVSVTSGGSQVRNDFQADFLAEDASFSLDGLAVLGGSSQVYQHATVHHRFPKNTSRQYFKNILSGNSAAEFTSLVHVWRGAVKSDAAQLDRNLLLSDTARVWSRPQLKIDADDVKANHGAATGQLQEQELFYLQSRGLDKKSAKYILTSGFADELLNQIEPAELREKIKAPVREKIKGMIG